MAGCTVEKEPPVELPAIYTVAWIGPDYPSTRSFVEGT
jgi:hypothetical protein